jgi:hypothetical protein
MADSGIKPAKGYALVKILEAPEQNDASPPTTPESEGNEGVLAQVISAASDVGAKPGQTVILRPYAARSGLKFSNMVFVDSYSIVAVIA